MISLMGLWQKWGLGRSRWGRGGRKNVKTWKDRKGFAVLPEGNTYWPAQ